MSTNSQQITLYGFQLSPPVRAVLLTLKALNLNYTLKEVNTHIKENLSADYLKKNPQHTVPTLEDDGKYIWDSHAIIAYLARKYGKDDSLYPKDYYRRAIVDQRLHFENGVLFMTCIKANITKPLRSGTATKEQIPEMVKSICKQYDMLEIFLADNAYFAGDSLTIADLSIITTVTTLACVAPIDADIYPKLSGWLKRMQQLPYYEEANGKGLKAIQEHLLAKLEAL